jgi:L-galactose dehydrogenase
MRAGIQGRLGKHFVNYNLLGKTGLKVSRLSFGASALGGVYGPVVRPQAIRAVYAALDCGINYFDAAPAYGGTLAETTLGQALKGIPRSRYVLSTKVGKYTCLDCDGGTRLDYSRERIRASVEASALRLGTDYFDILHLHDIEYQGRKHAEWALGEGYDAVCELKKEGRVGAVGFGIYPIDLWERIFSSVDIDAALVHNHFCLNDTRLLSLLPRAREKQIGIVNGSPFASALLTEQGPPAWHPSSPEDRAVFRQALDFCRAQGASLSRLALQFATAHPEIPTTLFSSADPEMVICNVHWSQEPLDRSLLEAVQWILTPVRNKDWNYV